VTAHAVDDRKHQRIGVAGDGDAILIFFPIAEEA
jgi:hypothetical protein